MTKGRKDKMRPGWLNMPYKYVFPLIQIMKEKGKLNKLKVSGTSMEPTIKRELLLKLIQVPLII